MGTLSTALTNVLVLHVHYHTYLVCYRNTELWQQSSPVYFAPPCISTKFGDNVYILLLISCVKFHTKICTHCWNINKPYSGYFFMFILYKNIPIGFTQDSGSRPESVGGGGYRLYGDANGVLTLSFCIVFSLFMPSEQSCLLRNEMKPS